MVRNSRSCLRAVAYVLTTTLFLTSCIQESGDGDGERVDDPPSLELPFVSGEECPSAVNPSLPPDAGCVTSVRHGRETLTVYALLDEESRPRAWRVRLRGRDVRIDRSLDAASSYPRAVGAADVDLDGRPEWWIRVMAFIGHGAPWARLHLFFVRDEELVPLRFEGQPLGINYGGISRLGEGAECRDGKLVLLRAEARDKSNTRWAVSERTFALAEGRARFLERTEHVLRVDHYNDPALDRLFSVRCEGAVLTPFS